MKKIALGIALLAVVSLKCFGKGSITVKLVYSISFVEHSDGCLLLPSNEHHYYTGAGMTKNNPTLQHYNDTALINADIKAFDAQCQKLHAVPKNDFQKAFENTPSGHYLYVYKKNCRLVFGDESAGYKTKGGYESLPGIPTEKVPLYTYTILEYKKP